MGSGAWSSKDFVTYSAVRGYDKAKSVGDIYNKRQLEAKLDIKGKIRESRNSVDHPNSFPILIGLDVTGSMGSLATEIAKTSLNDVMTRLYEKGEVAAIKDPQVAICAIGDTECDSTPIQMTQFESDIRVAEQQSDIFFEGGGGGNAGESYIAAWYCAQKHIKKDAERGLIITIGDEPTLNTIKAKACKNFFGDDETEDIKLSALLPEVRQSWDVYHICCGNYRQRKSNLHWKNILGDKYVKECPNYSDIANTVMDIIKEVAPKSKKGKSKLKEGATIGTDPMADIID